MKDQKMAARTLGNCIRALILIHFFVWHHFAFSSEDIFENKIRPLLLEHCYECHSADKKQKGGLLLDSKEGTLKGGDTGPALIPGNPAQSLIIQAVKWQHPDLEMPPKQKLSDAQIADLETWIASGAPDPRSGSRQLTQIETHLESAKKHWAFVPPVDPNPESLDSLIGLKPSPTADRRTLIRRAYFDLLGVPPTFAEVSAFIDDESPGALEALIDRLLADPRYGERWGRHWLDVARYADNMGSIYNGDDTYPHAFTYRDWVIAAFNSDKPYDRFLIEQIAADQLDSAKKDTSSLAGMGFLGLGRRKDRRLDDDTLDDTLDVIGRGLMGLTIGCARCHDHKLEPITTKDYYGLYSVLKNSREPDIQPPLPQIDSAETREYREKNRQSRSDYGVASIKAASQTTAEARGRVGDYLEVAEQSGWRTHYDHKPIMDVILKRKLHGDLHNATSRSRKAWVEAHPEVFGPFLEFITKAKPDPAAKRHPLVAKAFAKPVSGIDDLAKRYNDLFAAVDSAWRAQVAGELGKPIDLSPDELDLDVTKLQPRLIARLDDIEARHSLPDADQESLRQILIAKDSPFKIAPDRYATARLFPEEAKKEYEKIGRTIGELAKHPGAPSRAMTFIDTDAIVEGKVFVRGNPRTPGPDAPRQFLTVLKKVAPQPFPKDKSGRLDLAQAIASRDNPLTARVIVNRVWAWHFGDPLVATPSDFGFRGDKPANQPLLDHLAVWFMDHGWSFKALHKYLMLTAAWQRADFPMRPLELEPFRDALLSVSGRLDAAHFGKATKVSETNRRTIYAFVDRKTLPSLYRSFDFPDPNFSAPKRSRTALTPRALILLNSPLLTDSAKSLAASLGKDFSDESGRITELYRRVFQRDPTGTEIRRTRDFLAAYPAHDLVHPESQDWQYGFGEFDPGTKQVKAFASLTQFDGKAFRGSGVTLDAMGGDPGAAPAQSTIRRWIAPLDGEIQITAELVHMDEKSEGVTARILSSRAGILGEWTAKKQALCTDLSKVAVKKGDTLDFIVSSLNGKDAEAYQWSPSIVMPTADLPAMPGMSRRWDARVDFANPSNPAKPLTAWEELCQAVLLSPEFAALE
jgi:hypothetical protein